MSTTVTYKGNVITTVDNNTRTLLTQDRWVEGDITLTDSSRGFDSETDPIFSASPAASITQSNITSWNNKSTFSGNYNDLTNKPTIPAAQVNADWEASSGMAQILNKPNLSLVARTGSYNDLTNKPTIPTSISDLTNDSDYISTETDPVFLNSPAGGITANDILAWNNKSDFSGSYNDLTNKPVLDTSLSTASTRAVENQAISIALEDKASKQYVDTAISNIPSPIPVLPSTSTDGYYTLLAYVNNGQIEYLWDGFEYYEGEYEGEAEP